MPYELQWEPRGVYRRYYGHVTIDERQRSFDEICADPRFNDLLYSITDYLGVQSYEISPEATEDIASQHSLPLQRNPNIIIAAAVVDTQIVGAIEHFIAVKRFSQPYRMFPSVEAARTWVVQTQDMTRRDVSPG